ncbi:hypothetical protein HPB51_018533 [Rhipicephalus microplus]|uniref:Peptidase M13 N-terminal domain-containing protein n=1 Tax=Rhipicephalus microplus TaxID=6941 RepID=A0A9J6DIN4_RHIMP|nr:hypothetical protein HPB51_018533 [Rhipicephalus microplus]
MRNANIGVERKIPSSENVNQLRVVSVERRIPNGKQLRYVNVEQKIPSFENAKPLRGVSIDVHSYDGFIDTCATPLRKQALSRRRVMRWTDFLNTILRDAQVTLEKNDRIILSNRQYLLRLRNILAKEKPYVVANYLAWRVVELMGPLTVESMRRCRFRFDRYRYSLVDLPPLSRECYEHTARYMMFAVAKILYDQVQEKTIERHKKYNQGRGLLYVPDSEHPRVSGCDKKALQRSFGQIGVDASDHTSTAVGLGFLFGDLLCFYYSLMRHGLLEGQPNKRPRVPPFRAAAPDVVYKHK